MISDTTEKFRRLFHMIGEGDVLMKEQNNLID